MSPATDWAARLEALRLRLARSRTAPEVALIVALAAAFALNLWARHGNYLFYDEYGIVLHFYSFGDLFHPSNGHPVMIWLSLYYLMREVFGLGSALPYELVGIVAGLFAACVLYVAVRRRAGAWTALVAAVLLLFIASGVDILYWSFQLAFAGSVSAGLGAVLALDRGTRGGDLTAAALCVVSVFFLLVGLPFVVAAAVAVLVAADGGPLAARLRRLALVVGPVAVLFVAWYLGFGHLSPNRASWDNVVAAPSFIFEGLGTTLAYVLGLGVSSRVDAAGDWAVPLLLGAAGLAGWRCASGRPISRRVWVWVAGLVALWVLTAVNDPTNGGPQAGRYLYPSAVFMLLIAAELVRGLPLGRVAAALAALVLVVAVLGNRAAFEEAKARLGSETRSLEAHLGALEIARSTVDPRLQLVPDISGSPFEGVVDAGSFFRSADQFGSPALDPEEILAQSPELRAQVDTILRAALPVRLEPEVARPAGDRRCAGLEAGSELTRRRSLWLRAGPTGATLELRRFGDEFTGAGELGPGESGLLSIPADGASVPWRLRVDAGGARACG